MDGSPQAPLSTGFPRQEHWSGLSFPSPGDLPDPGLGPESSASAGRFFTAEPTEKPYIIFHIIIYISAHKFWTFSRPKLQASLLSPSSTCPGFVAFLSFLFPSFFLFCYEGYAGDAGSSLLTFLRLLLSEVRGLVVGDRCFPGFKGNGYERGLSRLCVAPSDAARVPRPDAPICAGSSGISSGTVLTALSANVRRLEGRLRSPSLSSP